MRKIFVTGIGTGIGKTVVSAILTKALKADYWKPIQAGDLHQTDTMSVEKWVDSKQVVCHDESYRLTQPMSPHAAANHDNLVIKLSEINIPTCTNDTLIIEGAGGLMVPINDNELIVDLIPHIGAEVVLVSQNYLGSINHTLLSIEALETRGLKVLGLIFNGDKNEATESIILKRTGIKELGRIDQCSEINSDYISNMANRFKNI